MRVPRIVQQGPGDMQVSSWEDVSSNNVLSKELTAEIRATNQNSNSGKLVLH